MHQRESLVRDFLIVIQNHGMISRKIFNEANCLQCCYLSITSEDLKVDVNLPFQRVSGGEALGDGIISMSKQKCYSSHLMQQAQGRLSYKSINRTFIQFVTCCHTITNIILGFQPTCSHLYSRVTFGCNWAATDTILPIKWSMLKM